MALFSSKKSRTQVSNTSVTDIDTTNVQQTDQSINTGQRFSNVGGGIVVTDASPEVITLASNVAQGQSQVAGASLEFAGNVVNAAGNAVAGIAQASADVVESSQDFASDINANSLESVTGIADRAFDSQDRALDRVADQAERSTGFLTQLTDNVLARDAVQNIAARTEGQLNEALRAVENVGTVGGQGNTKTQTIAIAAVLGGGILLFLLTRKK